MKLLKRWFPSLAMMAVIFGFSSIPSEEMPTLGGFDFVVKKLGHAIGYALLALFYSWGLGGNPRLAWLMAVVFSATDEIHQSFVPGRNPSVWDALVFDNLGAFSGLWIQRIFVKRKRTDMSSQNRD